MNSMITIILACAFGTMIAEVGLTLEMWQTWAFLALASGISINSYEWGRRE